ncbi:hypothetical protein EB75_04525 [Mycobacterium sp. ST-F2]|uniref:hypothetical protein n=1 Tax=Mycobacterium sp. ST-F2 TaxID=1490484 RepID=UPI00093DCC2F|nr:hypothetical protein [Mycobacterium sp. ST-F2]OKH84403.1 hypothetical protein EB75_04525 [Mycobacterium sp. ST-F2]
MSTELDQLLRDRFGIGRDDFVAALKTLPLVRPWATRLTEGEARLLDDVDFGEDHVAHIAASAEIAGHAGRLAVTALTTAEVKTALGLSDVQIRQKRLARELWAIPDGQTWIFPIAQFERDPETRMPFRQVRGLAEVLTALPDDLNPVAVDGFLHAQQPDLERDGHAQTPLNWLHDGGDVLNVVAAAVAYDWYGR